MRVFLLLIASNIAWPFISPFGTCDEFNNSHQSSYINNISNIAKTKQIHATTMWNIRAYRNCTRRILCSYFLLPNYIIFDCVFDYVSLCDAYICLNVFLSTWRFVLLIWCFFSRLINFLWKTIYIDTIGCAIASCCLYIPSKSCM